MYAKKIIMITTKLIVFLLIMCILNIIREAFHLFKCFRTMSEYKLDAWRTFLLWASISYIITVLSFGV